MIESREIDHFEQFPIIMQLFQMPSDLVALKGVRIKEMYKRRLSRASVTQTELQPFVLNIQKTYFTL